MEFFFLLETTLEKQTSAFTICVCTCAELSGPTYPEYVGRPGATYQMVQEWNYTLLTSLKKRSCQ